MPLSTTPYFQIDPAEEDNSSSHHLVRSREAWSDHSEAEGGWTAGARVTLDGGEIGRAAVASPSGEVVR